MTEQVVFCALSHKFVDEQNDVPVQAQQVIYYSLAIGHHLGVIDCLSPQLVCPLPDYQRWIATLPEGSTARRKMEGLGRYGEIIIDRSHVVLLASALYDALADQPPLYQGWTRQLLDLLQNIQQEPAIYLIVRRQP